MTHLSRGADGRDGPHPEVSVNFRDRDPGARALRPSRGGRPILGRTSAFLLLLCFLPLAGCITRLFGGGGEPTVAGEKGSIALS